MSVEFSGGGKLKAQSVKPVMAHNLRQKLLSGKECRENIDLERSNLNRYWINPKWQGQVGEPDWRKALDELKTDSRKIRKDAVLVRSLVFQASPAYFFPKLRGEGWTVERIEKSTFAERGSLDTEAVKKWEKIVSRFLQQKFGNCFLSYQLHLDERSPHIHAQIIPVVDGHLTAKKMLSSPAECRAFVDEVADACEPLGLARPREGRPSSGDIEVFRRKEAVAIQEALAEEPQQLTAFPPEMRPRAPIPEPEISVLDRAKGKAASIMADWEERETQRRKEDRARQLAYVEDLQRKAFLAAKAAQAAEARAAREADKARIAEERVKEWERLAKEHAQILREIPLEGVLADMYGATCIEKGKTSQWVCEGRKVACTDQVFIDNHDATCKGRGAIDLVMALDKCGFRQACAKLADFYGVEPVAAEAMRHKAIEKKIRADIEATSVPEPPDPVRHREHEEGLCAFLRHKGIPEELSQYLMESGQMYADERKNLVVLRQNGGCFKRGSYEPRPGEKVWKQTLGGKSCGPAVLRGPEHGGTKADVILCEGISDGIALMTEFPKATVVITGGNLKPTVTVAPEAKVFLAFDADEQGEAQAAHYAVLLKAWRPERLLPPKGKDWGEARELSATEARLREAEMEASGFSSSPRPSW